MKRRRSTGRLCSSNSPTSRCPVCIRFSSRRMLSAILTSAAIQFVLILTNGGPSDRTMIFSVLAYHLALGGAQRLGMGAAVSLVFFPILVVFIVFLTRRMLREKGE